MRVHNLLLSGLFIAMILSMSLAGALRALPYRVAADTDMVEGELTREFEVHYDKVFPVKTFGTNLWAAIQLALFDEGRDGVIVGRHGWLYTSEEFVSSESADERIAAHLALISRAQETLRQRGTELVVALIPAKARIYPEHLAQQRPSALHRTLYSRVHQDLERRGVRAPDLFAALMRCKAGTEVFLRTDTHWTPAGARCSAEALKDVAAMHDVAYGQSFHTQFEAPRPHQGDLVQFLPLAPHFSALLPRPDVIAASTTQAQGGDLLSEVAAPQIVLIGTSFSADERWNFGGALREVLAEDVLNLAEAGRGPFEPMLDYLDNPPAAPPPTRLIWEIPERYLPAGDALDPHDDRVQLVQASSSSQPCMQQNEEYFP